MKSIVNALCVLLLTFLLARLDDWNDTIASVVNDFSQTPIWIRFRSLLGVRGPEDEQALMSASILVAALAISVGVVWLANRLVRRHAVHGQVANRIAG